jgi:hypothetical protein
MIFNNVHDESTSMASLRVRVKSTFSYEEEMEHAAETGFLSIRDWTVLKTRVLSVLGVKVGGSL